MKRMSDVFDLPLEAAGDWLIEKTDNRCAEFDLETEAQYAAHAINHADKLADALDKLLSMLEVEGRQGDEIFKECEKVSNTYWGIK